MHNLATGKDKGRGRHYIIKKAVTLLEILVVVGIMAILASLGLPQLGVVKERALDKEARANLSLIQAAERIYQLEWGYFYGGAGESDVNNINSKLKLSLTERNWDYAVTGGGTLVATANRTAWPRTYTITEDPAVEACCCPKTSVCPSDEQCAICP